MVNIRLKEVKIVAVKEISVPQSSSHWEEAVQMEFSYQLNTKRMRIVLCTWHNWS